MKPSKIKLVELKKLTASMYYNVSFLFLQKNVFGGVSNFHILWLQTNKIWFAAADNSTCSTTYYYSRVVIITSTLGIWPALHSLRDEDTAAVYVLLLDQIEKKETLLAILLNDLEFQNK